MGIITSVTQVSDESRKLLQYLVASEESLLAKLSQRHSCRIVLKLLQGSLDMLVIEDEVHELLNWCRQRDWDGGLGANKRDGRATAAVGIAHLKVLFWLVVDLDHGILDCSISKGMNQRGISERACWLLGTAIREAYLLRLRWCIAVQPKSASLVLELLVKLGECVVKAAVTQCTTGSVLPHSAPSGPTDKFAVLLLDELKFVL